MKKSIFTFLFFILLLSFITSCFSSKKRDCDCPGMSVKLLIKTTK